MSRICEGRQPKVHKCRSELKVVHMAGYCSDRDAYDTFKNIAMSALLSRTRRYPEDLAGCLDSRPPTPVPFQSHPRTDQLSHLEHNQVTLSGVLASKSGLSLSGAHRCMFFDRSLLVHVTTLQLGFACQHAYVLLTRLVICRTLSSRAFFFLPSKPFEPLLRLANIAFLSRSSHNFPISGATAPFAA